MPELKIGMIIRHKGDRKVVRNWWRDKYGDLIIEFVDRTRSINYSDIEWDGRK